MSQSPRPYLLTINTGSSSLKAAVFEWGDTLTQHLTAQVERIGRSGGQMHIANDQGAILHDQQSECPSHAEALRALLA